MSKLKSSTVKISDLDVISEVASILGWTIETNVHVKYFAGIGPLCDVTLRPTDELDKYGRSVGNKYSIGFKETNNGTIEMYHDNAMNGAEVFSLESGKLDPTTERVINRLKTTITEAEVSRVLKKLKVQNWRTETRKDGSKVLKFQR